MVHGDMEPGGGDVGRAGVSSDTGGADLRKAAIFSRHMALLFIQRLSDWIRGLRSSRVLLVLMFAGISLVTLSVALGVSELMTDLCSTVTREVGYAAALNWSIIY